MTELCAFYFFLRVVFCGSSSYLFKNIFLRLFLRAPVWCLKKANIHPHHSICLRKTFNIISNQYVYLQLDTMRRITLLGVVIVLLFSVHWRSWYIDTLNITLQYFKKAPTILGMVLEWRSWRWTNVDNHAWGVKMVCINVLLFRW